MSTERTQRGGNERVQLMIQTENDLEPNPERRIDVVTSDQTSTIISQISMTNQQVVLRQNDSDSELSSEIPSDNYYRENDYNENDLDDFSLNTESTNPYFDVSDLQNQLRKDVDLKDGIHNDDVVSNGRKCIEHGIPLTEIKPLSEAHNQYRIKAFLKTGDIEDESVELEAINESQDEEENEIKKSLITIPCIVDISESCVPKTINCSEENNNVRNEENAYNIQRSPVIALESVSLLDESSKQNMITTNMQLKNDESEKAENNHFAISTIDSQEPIIANVCRKHGQKKNKENDDGSASSDGESLEEFLEESQDRIYGTCPKLNTCARRIHRDSGIGSLDSSPSPEVIDGSKQYFKEEKEATDSNYSLTDVNNNDMLGDVNECSCPLLHRKDQIPMLEY